MPLNDDHLASLNPSPSFAKNAKSDDAIIDLGKCCGRVITSKTLTCIELRFNSVERKKHGKGRKQLRYKDMDTDDEQSGFASDGQSFSFVFGYRVPQRLTVYGRNLLQVWEYICLDRMPWIESVEPSRDFAKDDNPVITAITVEAVPEEK